MIYPTNLSLFRFATVFLFATSSLLTSAFAQFELPFPGVPNPGRPGFTRYVSRGDTVTSVSLARLRTNLVASEDSSVLIADNIVPRNLISRDESNLIMRSGDVRVLAQSLDESLLELRGGEIEEVFAQGMSTLLLAGATVESSLTAYGEAMVELRDGRIGEWVTMNGDSILNMGFCDIGGGIVLLENSQLLVSNGSFPVLFSQGESRFEIQSEGESNVYSYGESNGVISGRVGDLTTGDDSITTIDAGSVRSLTTNGSSQVTMDGGWIYGTSETLVDVKGSSVVSLNLLPTEQPQGNNDQVSRNAYVYQDGMLTLHSGSFDTLLANGESEYTMEGGDLGTLQVDGDAIAILRGGSIRTLIARGGKTYLNGVTCEELRVEGDADVVLYNAAIERINVSSGRMHILYDDIGGFPSDILAGRENLNIEVSNGDLHLYASRVQGARSYPKLFDLFGESLPTSDLPDSGWWTLLLWNRTGIVDEFWFRNLIPNATGTVYLHSTLGSTFPYRD
ncbi:hypothetical protein [Pelagicoccus albus]|uniref:FecR family protein n=1 Tax=Pelagicoccus albus TaxID=415222 RepID=A0A7X1E8U2_9BACT|nr:hypothetical protein [Pelagicoccus albus]MBC2606666.1 hypothetical protein [Pelagicoccus albus]